MRNPKNGENIKKILFQVLIDILHILVKLESPSIKNIQSFLEIKIWYHKKKEAPIPLSKRDCF